MLKLPATTQTNIMGLPLFPKKLATLSIDSQGLVHSVKYTRKIVGTRFERCQDPVCEYCVLFDNNRYFTCSSMNLKVQSELDVEYYNCETRNAIYILTCNSCAMQYIGLTKRMISERLYEHLYDIDRGVKKTFLVKHFHKSEKCTGFNVRILAKLAVQDNEVDNMKRLMNAENLFIRYFTTAYPWGLNDSMKDYPNISKDIDSYRVDGSPFFNMPIKRRKRGKGRPNRQRANTKSVAELQQKYPIETGYRWSEMYCELQKYGNKIEKLIVDVSNTDLTNSLGLKRAILSFISGRLARRDKVPKIVYKQYPFKVNYINRATEHFRLETVLRDKRLFKALHKNDKRGLKMITDSRVIYHYEQPCWLTLCNHNKTLGKINENDVKSILVNDCDCQSSEFNYVPHGHIISGDLNIIEDQKLRNLFDKGAKYRIVPKYNIVQARNQAVKDIYNFFLNTLCRGNKTMLRIKYLPALYRAYQVLYNRSLSLLKNNNNVGGPDIIDWRLLKLLHQRFVIAPADKASNNFVFICKKYYVSVMCKELGIELVEDELVVAGNDTYSRSDLYMADIVDSHVNIARNWGLQSNADSNSVPKLFAIPKLHKVPYKFRYIAGGSKSSLKSISLRLQSLLVGLQHYFKNYCNKNDFGNRSILYWSIKNSYECKKLLESVDIADHIQTADFSTLFTALPHNIILEGILLIVNKCFDKAKVHYSVSIIMLKHINSVMWFQMDSQVMTDFRFWRCWKFVLDRVTFNLLK